MARKKVIFLIKYFYPVKRPSGISNFVYELANTIAHEVDLSVVSYWREKDNKKEYQYNNYRIYKVKQPFPLTAPLLAKRLKPDIVIIFSGIYQPLKTMLYFGTSSFLLGKKKQFFCQATNYSKTILPKYYQCFLKHFSKIIATNFYQQEQYKNLKIESELIPPGVNINNLQKESIKKVSKNKEIRIGFFGHFYNIKGPDRLLNIFLKINPPNAELIFSGGDGPIKKMVEEKAAIDSRINIIEWQNNIIPYIASCDLVVLPYRSSQSILGVAQSAIEAMALRIPVIGTKTPSLEFLIRNGYNGYLVKNDDELAEKLSYLIKDHLKRRELGKHACQTIKENYNIENIAKKYLNLIYGN